MITPRLTIHVAYYDYRLCYLSGLWFLQGYLLGCLRLARVVKIS
jgi:hypothetical protein